jgi:hypothetical protein
MSCPSFEIQRAITDWRREQEVNRALLQTVGARLALGRSGATEIVAMEEETWTTFVDA